MAFVIAQPCIGRKNGACVSVCPDDCIHPGEKMLYIDPDSCIDCAACQDACPVTAIFPGDELPPEWAHFAGINRRFYPDHDEAAAWDGVSSP